MEASKNDEGSWGKRSVYLMFLIIQTIGLPVSTTVPNSAVHHGTFGYVLVFVTLYILLGIPLLYMELIIGQFTGLNSLNMWTVRPFLSHFGYFVIFWQVIILLHNYINVSFCLHYFLVSFENPVPYYTCGKWATKNCDIFIRNYTVNQNCLKLPYPEEAKKSCETLYATFPEYQYYRYVIMKIDYTNGHHVSWQVALPSALACIVLYLSCFKRKKSMKWFLAVFSLYPILGFLILMMGTLLQKGIVKKFEEAFDADWTKFTKDFDFTRMVNQVIFSLGLGSGLAVNLGASCSFRAPCYANAAVSVAVGAAFTLLTVCTTAMMSCPYAYRYSCSPEYILTTAHMSLLYERVPRMLQEYSANSLWIILVYSCQACFGLRTVALIFFNLLETFAAKYYRVAKYPGLLSFFGVAGLFCSTLLFFSSTARIMQTGSFRRFNQLISVFIVLMECFVFVLWYGLGTFCEDVHFMQGIRPKVYMRSAWVASSVLLLYTFCNELYSEITEIIEKESLLHCVGFWMLILCLCFTVITSIIRLSISACHKRCLRSVQLSSAWRPRSELLQRSRAMFSAQAMTKEYLYRQYHLQAGILARQKRANVNFQNFME
ncbi:sodium-dependent noradrenaline transporter-like [Choristoneura fumiferana]|uniref:sodium-dependent noradrenaline transporter-like n=1 Tax=Choristoneura fumiferana TaxID=7141 RepID=UPI003D153D20